MNPRDRAGPGVGRGGGLEIESGSMVLVKTEAEGGGGWWRGAHCAGSTMTLGDGWIDCGTVILE
jgi:hypothetical protein